MMNRLNSLALVAAALLVTAPAALAETTAAQSPGAQSKADRTDTAFVKKAIEGNLAEVQMGQLAQQKGATQPVRDFGVMLAKDHSDANQQAMALAQKVGVTAPTAPNSEQKKMYDRLSKLSGAQFDREFAKAMVSDHKKDISEYQKEAKSKNANVAQYAQATLPHLDQHLKAAESLNQTAQAPDRSPRPSH